MILWVFPRIQITRHSLHMCNMVSVGVGRDVILIICQEESVCVWQWMVETKIITILRQFEFPYIVLGRWWSPLLLMITIRAAGCGWLLLIARYWPDWLHSTQCQPGQSVELELPTRQHVTLLLWRSATGQDDPLHILAISLPIPSKGSTR